MEEAGHLTEAPLQWGDKTQKPLPSFPESNPVRARQEGASQSGSSDSGRCQIFKQLPRAWVVQSQKAEGKDLEKAFQTFQLSFPR